MPPGADLARLLEELRPAEPALQDWVRPRIDASIVRGLAALDYGMDIDEHEQGIEDLVGTRRLPEELPWTPGEVLRLSSHSDPDATDRPGHVARLFSCLMLVRTGDGVWPGGALAGLVLIVLLAYLIGRKRSHAGYQTI